ncbi:MAG: Crp/Fnr family transcriptional regulator [Flavobacteriales bacterium]|nr:Crp/Fnr family transcriptional regulator [Flavobacteriales bacterium]
MTNQHDLINSIHTITEEEYQLFSKGFKTITYKKGENICSPGQIVNRFYFIKKGVLMYYSDINDKTNILGFAYPPNFCTIPESFYYQKPAKYYLSCLTDCEIDYLTFEGLQNLFVKSQQIETLFRKLAEALVVGLINRQIELRTTSIEERFKIFCRRSPHLLQLIPHKYIASYLAINPTNFSKLFNSVKF